MNVNEMSSRPMLVDDDVGGGEGEVHAVLRAHDPEVGDEVRAAAAQVPGPADPGAAGRGPARCARR